VSWYARVLINVSTVQSQVGKTKEAEKNLLSAIELIENARDTSERTLVAYAYATNNAGALYLHIGHFSIAKQFLNKSLNTQKRLILLSPSRNELYLESIICNIGVMETYTREYAKSEENFLNALRIVEKYCSDLTTSCLAARRRIYQNLVNVFMKNNDLNKGEKYIQLGYQDAKELYRRSPEEAMDFITYLTMMQDFYTRKGMPKLVKKYASEAESVFGVPVMIGPESMIQL
jgi:tetratricopeptide (TPR) repeat protein